MLPFPGSSQQNTFPPTVDTHVGLCQVLGSSERGKKILEPDVFKTLWLKYPSKIFSLCSAQREVTVACSKTDIRGEHLCQIKVFYQRGEKSDVPSKAADLRGPVEAEGSVTDHIHF